MLNIADFAPLFIEACPGAEKAVEELRQNWEGRPTPYYLEVGEFCSYLIECSQSGDIETLKRAFRVVELFLTEGDEEVCTYVAVGLLNGLQGMAASRGYDYRVFEPYMKRRSLQAWNDLLD